MSKKLFGLPDLTNKVSRNGFDLSRRNVFTAKTGELLPVAQIECLPGDHFELKTHSFTRTQPCDTAAYTRIRESFDWFFVPLRLIQKTLPQSLVKTDSPVSAKSPNSSMELSDRVPCVNSIDVVKTLHVCGLNKVIDDAGFNAADTTVKLLSYLGYNQYIKHWDYAKHDFIGKDITAYDPNVKMSLIPLAVYQKIYQDFFRFEQWEKARPYLYNFDYLPPNTTLAFAPLVERPDALSNSFFGLRYVNYPRDMFFGILPKAQYGDVATISFDVDTNDVSAQFNITTPQTDVSARDDSASTGTIRKPTLGQYRDSSGNDFAAFQDVKLEGKHLFIDKMTATGTSKVTLGSIKASFDILQLRKAQALQRYSEISQTGSPDYREQIRKHWGINVPSDLSNLCYYIGSSTGVVTINEQVNSTLVDKDSTAFIKGVGRGDSDGFANFDCKEHGMLMCLYHAEPIIDYSLTRSDCSVTRVLVDDFAQPEFDRLGLQAESWLNMSSYGFANYEPRADVIGYLPRYYDYKTAIDTANGAFTTTLPNWVAQFDENYLMSWLGDNRKRSIDYTFFKVRPTLIDPIFRVASDSSVNTDQLLVSADFGIHVVRNLDFDGMPY